MRTAFALCSFLVASPALAAEFDFSSKVSEVIAYTAGGLITREMRADLPAGQHQLNLIVPQSITENGRVRLVLPEGSGLNLISTAFEIEDQVPVRMEDTPQMTTARAVLAEAEAALRDYDLSLSDDLAKQRSAEARLSYLSKLTEGAAPLFGETSVSLNAEQFGARIAEMGAQVALAEQDLAQASAALDARLSEQQDLLDAVEHALAVLDAVTPAELDTIALKLTLVADAPYAGPLELQYLTNRLRWNPEYELDLEQDGAEGTLAIKRRASVIQGTGEDWEDVTLTLSTAAIAAQMQTHLPRQQLQFLIDPERRNKQLRQLQSKGLVAMADQPMMVEEEDMARFVSPIIKGQTIEFVLNQPQSLKSDQSGGGALIDIDQIDLSVDLFAKANASRDAKGYLYTELLNTTGGNLLPGQSSVYRDGAFMGQTTLPAITTGDKADVSFGPLDGLLLERRTISREDGDTGIITSSNSREIRYETKVTSLLDYPIDLQLFDSVPVSESEDLRIEEVLAPKPDARDIDGRRGVLRWDFAMTPGAVKTLKTGYDQVWPTGQEIGRR